MRMVFGVLSLLLVVVVIGLLAKKQLGAMSSVGTVPETSVGVASPMATPQQLQDQVKKSVDAAMQQARPVMDDK